MAKIPQQSKEPVAAASFFYSRVELDSCAIQRQLEVPIVHNDNFALKILTYDIVS